MVANSCVLSEPHKQQGYGRTRGSEQTQVMGSVELLVVVEGSVEAQSVSVIYPPCPQVAPRPVMCPVFTLVNCICPCTTQIF